MRDFTVVMSANKSHDERVLQAHFHIEIHTVHIPQHEIQMKKCENSEIDIQNIPHIFVLDISLYQSTG